MKKTIWLSMALGVVLLSVSACSFKTSNQKEDLGQGSNQIEIDQLKNEVNRLSEENESLKETPVVEKIKNEPVVSQSDFKTYSNKELGISFNYSKDWPEPVFVKNAVPTGGMFDVDGQWEVELGDLHKNSLEGADKYFASVRGVYKQSRSDILKKIKADEKEGLAKLIKETDSYIVYNEAGIVGVKNIMIFGKNKTIRIQSLGDTLDSEIDSIADSLKFN